METRPTDCPGCAAPLRPGLAPWHFECAACHYETSSFAPDITNPDLVKVLDESMRSRALEPVRTAAALELLRRIEARGLPAGAALLDVGAGHGDFLRLAQRRYRATGIDPAPNLVHEDVSVVEGYFPQDCPPGARYDVIVFNDSIEHFPDLAQAAADAAALVRPGGLVCITLPNRRGVIYRTSKVLARLGMRGPFERMWNVGLPSPHLHYVDERHLRRIAADRGLRVVDAYRNDSVARSNVADRVGYIQDGSRAGLLAKAMVAPLWVFARLQRWLPADSLTVLAERPAERPADAT